MCYRQTPTGGADYDLCADMRLRRSWATLIAGGHFGADLFLVAEFRVLAW